MRPWRSQVGQLASQGPASDTLSFPPPPAPFSPEDCKAIRFSFLYSHDDHFAYEALDKKGEAPLNIVFSPALKSQAVVMKGAKERSGSLLWVDGLEVPVPRNPSGDPQCERTATWLDERFVCAGIGGLWDHPLAELAVNDPSFQSRTGPPPPPCCDLRQRWRARV